MAGIFYDPRARKLRVIHGVPEPGLSLVTHNTSAGLHQCRRILSEWLEPEEAIVADWSGDERR